MGKKKGNEGKNKSKKKKNKVPGLAPDAVAMKKRKNASEANMFETLWARKKFNILGKKQKGQGRRVGLSRSLAMEKRKKTLLQEYKQSGKANMFLDRRFGENDESLGDEDKAIIRFQRERQGRMVKQSKFALSDGDDDILTHHGAALSTLDDFEDDIAEDDEDISRDLEDTMTRKLNFGLGSHQDKIPNAGVVADGENKHKSKKEIMEEIIAKSKFYKAQKAKEKEEDEDLKEKLDKDFTALTQSEGLLSLMRPHKDRLKELLNKGSSKGFKDERKFSLVEKTEFSKDQPDDYDKLVREMVLDIRGHASERTKTPEEIAQDERERLEALEKERSKRMLDNEDFDDDDNDEKYKNDSTGREQKTRKMLSGDDLGDSFFSDEELDEKGWVDEVLERNEEDSEDNELDDGSSASEETDEGGEDDSDSEGLNEQDWEQSDDEYDYSEKKGEMLNELKKSIKDNTEMETQSQKSHKVKAVNITAQQIDSADKMETLPFVINAPNSLRELRSLLHNRSDDQIIEAIRRIRVCNAISLAAENRHKMQVFYGVLLQYFAVLADEKPLKLNKLNLLVQPLLEISLEIPYFAAICARQRLIRIRNQMTEDLRNPDKGNCWPSSKTLLLLRIWSLIFPSSDFRHVVMTPAILLMSECLMRCPVNCGRDIAVGTFLCSMLLSVTREARRFCPEAINFVHALLISAVATKTLDNRAELKHKLPTFMLEHLGFRPWLCLSSRVSVLPRPLDFAAIMEAGDNSPLFESNTYRVGIIYSVIETLRGFVNIYHDIASFPEVFATFVPLLHEVAKENNIPESLQTIITGIAHLISEKIEEHHMLRQPLRMRMQKPVPIKQFNPRFEENFVHGRDYDPDRERAQRKKLQRQIKQEAKGAARELRKDNYFLQEVKAQDRAVAEEERAEKYRKALAFLQEQESAFKSGQLGKGRKKGK
ncbi:hypothetical protein SUGI_0780240 [Cryptomeria japonica]|uniref:uncharacterized protein LOC131068949 n=1 Tax=Cryptomeria japonica TaxID=3369 RepID=UPI002414769C|nr:uncharacterized protein LOC131068949 [Cryptomeria japonica]GLJ38313.1 hypothetical protein SUGI_0780240 [Cryptomeria japonica]